MHNHSFSGVKIQVLVNSSFSWSGRSDHAFPPLMNRFDYFKLGFQRKAQRVLQTASVMMLHHISFGCWLCVL